MSQETVEPVDAIASVMAMNGHTDVVNRHDDMGYVDVDVDGTINPETVAVKKGVTKPLLDHYNVVILGVLVDDELPGDIRIWVTTVDVETNTSLTME